MASSGSCSCSVAETLAPPSRTLVPPQQDASDFYDLTKLVRQKLVQKCNMKCSLIVAIQPDTTLEERLVILIRACKSERGHIRLKGWRYGNAKGVLGGEHSGH